MTAADHSFRRGADQRIAEVPDEVLHVRFPVIPAWVVIRHKDSACPMLFCQGIDPLDIAAASFRAQV